MAQEKEFENKVCRFLESKGVYRANTPKQKMTQPIKGWFFKVWGGGFQQAGIPDLICNINGKFVAVELKAENGRPSELQTKNVNMIIKGGGYAFILYPSDFEKFKNFVNRLL